MIQKILEYCEDDQVQRLKEVAKWKFSSTENILLSFLKNRQDMVAAEFSHYYVNCASEHLLVFCMENQNEVFLKHAFNKSFFVGSTLATDNMIEEIMK